MVAVPARHPLLALKRIRLEDLLRYPLVLRDPVACESHAGQVERVQAPVSPEDMGPTPDDNPDSFAELEP